MNESSEWKPTHKSPGAKRSLGTFAHPGFRVCRVLLHSRRLMRDAAAMAQFFHSSLRPGLRLCSDLCILVERPSDGVPGASSVEGPLPSNPPANMLAGRGRG